ncbi:hypothetical protein QL093DRAFT_2569919 [Fusarium oxysporum]|nr:hypothetical protein QL093DRAFT_2569919 [Fusarium oxysporum]
MITESLELCAYSSELVIPSSIQYRGHYDSNFPDHWDGTLNHGTSTPKVSTSTRQVTNNPRAELDKAAQDNSPTPASHSSTYTSAPSPSAVASHSPASQNSHTSISSKSTSMAPTASTTSNQKNKHNKLNDAPEEHLVRASHNRVEKQYRNRLNAQFESLLNALPTKIGKGEVLEMARKGIQALERENNELQRENLELQGSLRQLKGPASDDTVSSSDLERPFNFNKCVQ